MMPMAASFTHLPLAPSTPFLYKLKNPGELRDWREGGGGGVLKQRDNYLV